MLKAVIDKSALEALDEGMQALYKPTADGGYSLDITGIDDHPGVAGLRKTKEDLLAEKRKLMGATDDERDRLHKEIAAHEARERGLMEEQGKYKELYESERGQREAAEASAKLKLEQMHAQMDEKTVAAATQSLAGKLGGTEYGDALLPHLEKRFKVFEIDGQRELRVVDAVGNATAMTVEDLAEELRNTSFLKPLIVGPRSQGGGAAPAGGNGGTPSEHEKYFDPKSPDHNITQQGLLLRTDRAAYDALRKKYPL